MIYDLRKPNWKIINDEVTDVYQKVVIVNWFIRTNIFMLSYVFLLWGFHVWAVWSQKPKWKDEVGQ